MNAFFTTAYDLLFHGTFFAIALSIIAYQTGVLLHKKFPYPFVNPLLIATIITILVLYLLKIPYSDYKKGGDIIHLWLAPITEVLAISIYNKRDVLKKNIIPVIAAVLAGAVTNVLVVYFLGKAFKLDEIIIYSLLPKSVTTPIALSLCNSVNGIQAITISGLLITGIFGGMFAPQLVKLFRIKNPVAAGVAIGSCSHAVGTSTALQMGEIEGAMSSIAIGCMGLATTLVFIFI